MKDKKEGYKLVDSRLGVMFFDKDGNRKIVMENKYYTPELEEFYVGFEYYTTTHPVSMEEFSPYVKGEFDHNTFEREFNIDTDSSGEIIKIGVPSCIKVKYLDTKDIESLGFKQYFSISSVVTRIYSIRERMHPCLHSRK